MYIVYWWRDYPRQLDDEAKLALWLYIPVTNWNSLIQVVDSSGCGKTKGCLKGKNCMNGVCDYILTWSNTGNDSIAFELSGVVHGLSSWLSFGMSLDDKMVRIASNEIEFKFVRFCNVKGSHQYRMYHVGTLNQRGTFHQNRLVSPDYRCIFLLCFQWPVSVPLDIIFHFICVSWKVSKRSFIRFEDFDVVAWSACEEMNMQIP